MSAASLSPEALILQVLTRYCRSMDRIDPELGYTVWHEDGMAHYGDLFSGTGRGFIDWVCDYHRTLVSQNHQLANSLITVSGDRAVSEAYVTVRLLEGRGDSHLLRTHCGRYLDTWSRRDGRWAIDDRRYVDDFFWAEEIAAQLGSATRDESDASYAVLNAL